MLTTSIRQRRCEAVRSTSSHGCEGARTQKQKKNITLQRRRGDGDSKQRFSGLYEAEFAGTLTSFIPIPINYTYLLLPIFLGKIERGANFPRRYFGDSRLLGMSKILIRTKFLFFGGERGTGADVSPTAQGDDPLGNPRFAGAWVGMGGMLARCFV